MKFKRPTYTTIPNEMIDTLMAGLSGAEFKVLVYVARRTFGFHRDAAGISFSQLCTGLVTRDGRRLDCGTGLGRSTVQAAVESLETAGYLVVRRNTGKNGALASNTYTLLVEDAGAPGGEVAGDDANPVDPMPEICIGGAGGAMPEIGIGCAENRHSYKEEKKSSSAYAGNKAVGVGQCKTCRGYGVVAGGRGVNAGYAIEHNGTLDRVRALLADSSEEIRVCDCPVGTNWQTLIVDAELPLVPKPAKRL